MRISRFMGAFGFAPVPSPACSHWQRRTLLLSSRRGRPSELQTRCPPVLALLRGRPSNPNSRFPEPDFEPFDGSVPMLPPWRPASPEEDFGYYGARVRARERAAKDVRPIVAVAASDGSQEVLYAELVQSGLKGGRAWLRPLMMMTRGGLPEQVGDDTVISQDAWLDMRATSDVFLPESLVVKPDEQARLLVAMSVAASEQDLLERCIRSQDDFENNRFILSAFVSKLNI